MKVLLWNMEHRYLGMDQLSPWLTVYKRRPMEQIEHKDLNTVFYMDREVLFSGKVSKYDDNATYSQNSE